MARNGSGVYAKLAGSVAVTDDVIASSPYNLQIDDVVNALNDTLMLSGVKPMTGALAMGTNKITGGAAATAATDFPLYSQVQSGVVQQATVVGGTVDAITLTHSPVRTAYTTDMEGWYTSGGTNTIIGATMNIDSLGVKTIRKAASVALAVGDLGASGHRHHWKYNGTYVIITNPVQQSASLTAEGIVELATSAEVLTGTDAVRAVTPDTLAPLWTQGSDIASAGTITVGDGGYFDITGTTTITDIDLTTTTAGREVEFRFTGALTLTYNASNLILPGARNIKTASGDIARFRSEGGDIVRCVGFQRLNELVEYNKGAYAASTDYSQAHGLGVMPRNFEVWLECTTTDLGYAVGDRINADSVQFSGGYPNAVSKNATNLRYSTEASASTSFVVNFSTNDNSVAITEANWDVIFVVDTRP